MLVRRRCLQSCLRPGRAFAFVLMFLILERARRRRTTPLPADWLSR
jgi:hypothetical protein